MKGFKIGLTENGKDKYMVCSSDVDHVEKSNGIWRKIYDKHNSAFAERSVRKFDWLPCGKCIECRLRYSREWANRCMLELQYHKESWFVTLTYDDLHVPHAFYDEIDKETGEITPMFNLTLVKKDISDFMKRLRTNYERFLGKENHLRFFACGEYGGKTQRPHYHLIIFGLELPEGDLKPVSHRGTYDLFSSKFISKAWDKGFNTVGAVSWDTCAYTARYILKKQKGDASVIYDMLGIEPEFTLMSRMPGIAKRYYDEHKEEIYKFDTIWMKLKEKGYKCKPPKVYDRYYDVDDPDRMKSIKDNRKAIAEGQQRKICEETKLNWLEYLMILEANKESKIKGLERRLEKYA